MKMSATEKQVKLLKSLGIKHEEDISVKDASKLISEKLGNQGNKSSGNAKVDITSYYVSYAKDLLIELIKLERYKDIAPLVIMEEAIECIKLAINGFKD